LVSLVFGLEPWFLALEFWDLGLGSLNEQFYSTFSINLPAFFLCTFADELLQPEIIPSLRTSLKQKAENQY